MTFILSQSVSSKILHIFPWFGQQKYKQASTSQPGFYLNHSGTLQIDASFLLKYLPSFQRKNTLVWERQPLKIPPPRPATVALGGVPGVIHQPCGRCRGCWGKAGRPKASQRLTLRRSPRRCSAGTAPLSGIFGGLGGAKRRALLPLNACHSQFAKVECPPKVPSPCHIPQSGGE